MHPPLHSWRDPRSQVRIAVNAWVEIARVEDQYIQRAHDLRMVWSYLRHVGPVAVARKIRSRLAETSRNRKVAGAGVGRILDAPGGGGLAEGEWVAFFAPNVTEEPSSVVCDARMVVRASELECAATEEGSETGAAFAILAKWVGWSPYSGVPLDEIALTRAIGQAVSESPVLRGAVLGRRNELPGKPEARDRSEASHEPRTGRPTAVLFGFGNYAKTQVLPTLRRRLDLRCIHEIDPQQLAPAARCNVTLDTSPWPREGETYDAWFIAGFHHTHAPLAVHALKQGSYAVVEKPLATSWEQLESLETTLAESGKTRLFGCFQRRYTPMNDWAARDLGVASGEAINYHCIVYEIPLPERHWYNWPNSGSRLTSNGCHWVDHFLFLNGYPELVSYRVQRAGNGDLFVLLEAENGASFSMVLTERGSERLGVRDYVELRANGVTVRMVDQARYEAENSKKVLRRKRLNPSRVYATMYSAAVDLVLNGEEGDDPRTLLSTKATLLLEDQLAEQYPHAAPAADFPADEAANPNERTPSSP